MSAPTPVTPGAFSADDAVAQRKLLSRQERAERREARKKFFQRIPLTARGIGMLVAGVLSLALAGVLGRRELLAISLFLIALPLTSIATVYLGRRQISMQRTFTPHPITAGQTTRVSSRVIFPSTRGSALLVEEHLPASFGANPQFTAAPHDSTAFSYRLRPSQRGTHTVGPATAHFTDVLGLAKQRVTFGEPSALCVLPRTNETTSETSSGAQVGNDNAPTLRHSSPDMDDVMVREYRDGDPLRRIHWPASARHGELMVRQEIFSVRYHVAIMLDAARTSYGLDVMRTESSSAGAERSATELTVPRFDSEPGTTTEDFNRALELTATLVSQMQDNGVTVDVFDHSGTSLNEGLHSVRGYVSRSDDDSVTWILSELGLNEHPAAERNHNLPITENQTLMLITHRPTTEHAERLVRWFEQHRKVTVVMDTTAPARMVFENAGWTVTSEQNLPEEV
ncbi:DUF58 domain-containing protein [Neomicrococcus lactis]|uniref:Uncharacterized protein (DUF58 family) n=1 Tax=Neomicrococcus lactis TaxID=732241 RepID=A0A7W8YBM9_9MICC|nr:DUF58 domain-containing protein [Neomicrococcus lactis]MBB5598255.1 uncharacterized protein (DUF58 family) [Neomicrococcus lactis]